MLKGVTEKELGIIQEILKQFDAKFYAYGSRVKGNFSALSDLDVMVISDEYEKILPKLKDDFDKSRLSYVVNFVNFKTLDKNFYDLIKDDLTEL